MGWERPGQTKGYGDPAGGRAGRGAGAGETKPSSGWGLGWGSAPQQSSSLPGPCPRVGTLSARDDEQDLETGYRRQRDVETDKGRQVPQVESCALRCGEPGEKEAGGRTKRATGRDKGRETKAASFAKAKPRERL